MITNNKKYLTWSDLAVFYKKKTGSSAYTKNMEVIYDWAVKQDNIVEDRNGLYILDIVKDINKKDDKENNMFSETIKELKDISIRLEIVLNALEEHCNSNDVKDFPAIPDLNEAIDLLYDVINNLEEKMERENEC